MLSLRPKKATAFYLLWVLLILYVSAQFLELLSGGIPTLKIVALQVLPAALFAIVHGALTYRFRGIITLVSLCLIVGSFFESLS